MVRMLKGVVASVVSAKTVAMTWDEAHEHSSRLLQQMTRDQKERYLRSAHVWQSHYYVSAVDGDADLGIPPLKPIDSGNGYREMYHAAQPWRKSGGVTAFPMALAMAATWNRETVRKGAEAIGEEFAAKGSNNILGPGLSVHRFAKGGRNWESLAGEDPYLGAQLGSEFIKGVQSKGVMATMKHYVFNEQENYRGGNGEYTPLQYNAVVDDKTAWELYYEPFRAAVEAGCAAAMCSYNEVDGTSACGNEKVLKEDLKGAMGFRGFVMSDWGATRNMTNPIKHGLDIDMQDHAPDDLDIAGVSDADLDDAAGRILAAMHKVGVFDAKSPSQMCVPPNCDEFMNSDVTSDEHTSLAKEAAAQAMVMLKNDNDLLPLTADKVKTIVMCGSAADARQRTAEDTPDGDDFKLAGDQYSGGGSGHIRGKYVVTPLEGVSKRADALGIKVVYSMNDDEVACRRLIRSNKADVTIIAASTSSREEVDRADLELDNRAGALIEGARVDSKAVVVLASVPGAVLTPWRESADAILMTFLGGQELGNGYAAVLFGEHAPTGRLPISLPATMADTIEPCGASERGPCNYSEGMATGYRSSMVMAYDFGYGLTFTDFTLGTPEKTACDRSDAVVCIKVAVTNSGKAAAAAVPQLYAQFPSESGYPAPVLKGFETTAVLQPGESADVVFPLTLRDMSYWSNGDWVKVDGLGAQVGFSSRGDKTYAWVAMESSEVVV